MTSAEWEVSEGQTLALFGTTDYSNVPATDACCCDAKAAASWLVSVRAKNCPHSLWYSEEGDVRSDNDMGGGGAGGSGGEWERPAEDGASACACMWVLGVEELGIIVVQLTRRLSLPRYCLTLTLSHTI